MESSKKRGFRSITVHQVKFNWRFSKIIDIRPDGQKDNQLKVDFGWYDSWLYINDKENEPPDFEPKKITSGFVSQSIDFALKNGWDIHQRTGTFEVEYRSGVYKVLET